MTTSQPIAVGDTSQVAAARRAALLLAANMGFAEETRANLALIATEAASNLCKHAVGGQVVLRPLEAGSERGIELICVDRGPGMADVAACMRDGFSTAGSMGTGLGAMRRLATNFDLYSVVGQGTVLVVQLWERRASVPEPHELALGALSIARRGESECGDDWSSASRPRALLLVDGLGHGQSAAYASQQAIEIFLQGPAREPELQIRALDEALRRTRGAAAAVVRIDPGLGTVRYCGVGNTCGALLHADGVEHLVSMAGTLGCGVHRIRTFEYGWTPETTLVLHTDGISARWDVARYPGILRSHPSVLAAALYRDFARESDDATVLVAREVA